MAEIEETKSDLEGLAKDTENSANNIVNSANLDPGAPQASIDTLKKNSENESAAVESLANNGDKNSKLTENPSPVETDKQNDIS